ncbi:SCP2 domain-containing protein [Martelella alba]|uniref:SCP2 domain-containing protein n=1 Tax=Martelella alba TaxID=2590451 RepID=A0A506UGE3_9HYPH|nr:SCP2 sterol-binding domain-containing protein [Martelella alba]TPW32501.1 SCP2 domain-containing protein [Martelella alba]
MRLPPAIAIPFDLVPIALAERTANMLLHRLMRKHPALFERLGEHKAKAYAFRPVDLPFTFVISPAAEEVTVLRSDADIHADATVEGPFFILLALMEGRLDGDALFFSRDLSVSGDMEATLALRNALDDCEIDLPSDLAPLAGPFAPLVAHTAARIRGKVLFEEPHAWN